jgi:hypothetical protein
MMLATVEKHQVGLQTIRKIGRPETLSMSSCSDVFASTD